MVSYVGVCFVINFICGSLFLIRLWHFLVIFTLYYFICHLTVEVSVCGEVLNDSSGTLRSPDSDNDGLYDHNVDCQWIIVVHQDTRVELKILSMDIEQDETCGYDFLRVNIKQLFVKCLQQGCVSNTYC